MESILGIPLDVDPNTGHLIIALILFLLSCLLKQEDIDETDTGADDDAENY